MGKTAGKTDGTKGRFTKENPRPGPGRGKRKPQVVAAAEAIVVEMEKAYANPPSPDDTVGVKGARKLAADDYPKFLATWLKAKELAGHGDDVHGAERNGDKMAAAAGVDPGPKEETLMDLAHRLLDEWEAEDGRSARSGGEIEGPTAT